MQQTLVEKVCELEIRQNAFRDDHYFRRRVSTTHGVPDADCVSLRDCLPSKSQTQAVVAVVVNPIGQRSLNCFLLSDLHGVTARLIVSQGAAGHPCLVKARTRPAPGSSSSSSSSSADTTEQAQVVLLARPVVTFDKASNNCTLYVLLCLYLCLCIFLSASFSVFLSQSH